MNNIYKIIHRIVTRLRTYYTKQVCRCSQIDNYVCSKVTDKKKKR